MLPAGVAVWPGSATQVASRVWLPSRPTTTIASVSWWAYNGAMHNISAMYVPHGWLLSDTVEASRLVPTCAICCADTVACGGGEVGDRPATPTHTPIVSTTAAAAAAVQVIRRVRRRRQRTVAGNDGSNSGDISATPDVWSASLIAAT